MKMLRIATLLLAFTMVTALGGAFRDARAQSDVARIADRVRSAGNPSTLSADWLPVLGLGPASLGTLPTRNKSYGFEDNNAATYAFSLVVIDGREEMVVARALPGDMTAWRIDKSGAPLVTVRRDGDGMRTVTSAPYAAMLQKVLAALAGLAGR